MFWKGFARLAAVAVTTALVAALSAVPAQAAERFCSRTAGTCWAGPINANSTAHYIVIYGWSDACATVDAYDYDNGNHVGT